ncbi:MAG TPA: 16S rRNA (cytidine(1402)-2'-O)-methyltransferase [Bacteroidota bacterium]|jgi:16S rRNA (cytidine1402-2'-O)-methyltransferase
MNPPVQKGTLYIVSTPIGNLEDISIRAVRTLSEVDLIAAEDTRTTRILLDHYGIRKPLISYYSYNEARRAPELLSKLRSGSSIALVSDAGTPGISDPAFRVVSSALEAGIPVKTVPGASALLPALIVSGLPSPRFAFEGFLPVKKGRKTRLGLLREEEGTIILYESPHRLLKTLRELRETLGEREISVARELTKKFEEVVRGSAGEVLEHFLHHTVRGEFVIVVAGAPAKPGPGRNPAP